MIKKILLTLLKRSKETTFVPIVIFIILFCITNIVAIGKLISVVKNIITWSLTDNIIIWEIVWIADYVLVWIVLYILASWIYDLFIDDSDHTQLEWWQFISKQDIDELKERVAKLIIVILIIYVFKSILTINISWNIDILYISWSIVLLALSIKLISKK